MKRKMSILFMAIILIVLSGCQMQDSYSGKVVLSGKHRIQPHETIHGELVVTGGEVHLMPGSQVTGSVHLFGGKVFLNGSIDTDVLILSGQLETGPRAIIHGDLNQVGGTLTMDTGSQIIGQKKLIDRSGATSSSDQAQAGRWFTLALELPLLTAFAFLAARFLPKPLVNVGQAGTRYWLPSMALGLLAWVVGLSLLLIMAYTILLIPLAIVSFFMMLIATTYGAVPYAIQIGQLLNQHMKWNLPYSGQAALGMILLIVLFETARFIPILGPFLPLLLFTTSFGAVLLTRFGLDHYVPPNLDSETINIPDPL